MLTKKEILERTKPDTIKDMYFIDMEDEKQFVMEFTSGEIVALKEQEIQILKELLCQN